VGIEEIIGSKVFSESRFNNTFNDFRDERKIRNRTIVSALRLCGWTNVSAYMCKT